MTDKQILEILEEIRPNIQKLARVFHPKIKQPSILSIQDLVREGEFTVIHQIKLGRPNGKEGKISTYLIRSVITHFADLMHESYRQTPIKIQHKEIDDLLLRRRKISFGFDKLNTVMFIVENFNIREKEYITKMLFLPQDIQNKIIKNRKRTRKLVRESLNMTSEEERILRKSIKEKLERKNVYEEEEKIK